jgi:hypothetical protein
MAYRSSSQYQADSTGSAVVPAPAGIVSGDYLIAVIANLGSGTDSLACAGWTFDTPHVISNGASALRVTMASKVAGGSEPGSYTFTSTFATGIAAVMGCYSGRTALDVQNFANPNLATPPASPVSATVTGITTSSLDDVIYVGVVQSAVGGGISPWTAPSGMALRQQNTGNWGFRSMVLADLSQGSAGPTGNLTGIWSNSGSSGNYVAYAIGLSATVAAPSDLMAGARQTFVTETIIQY